MMVAPPLNPSAVRIAIIEMIQRGLTDRDIGSALRIDPVMVRRLIAAEDTQAAAMCAVAWSAKPYRLEAR